MKLMNIKDILHRASFGKIGRRDPVIGVLRLQGVISPRVSPRSRGLSLAGVSGLIDRAFGLANLKAVALSINSPGGSPVQSALIQRRIRQLAREKSVPVIAFAEDVAASGGYWLALAADEIYAEETSIVGSIGVISAGFGFTDLLRRLGVQRRVYTAGENKGLLDPFLDENPDDIARLKSLQLDIHESFKDLVRARRGMRLKDHAGDVFTGAVFTGRQALTRGLVDGIGDLRGILRDRFGDKVRLRVVEERPRGFRLRLPGLGAASGPLDLGMDLLAAVEERAAWSRFGL